MVKTASKMLPLGTRAPEFELMDTTSDQLLSLKNINHDKGLVVMFICNHCPYVILINDKLVEIANEYIAKGMNFVAISSNNAEAYPQDGPAEMAKHAKLLNYPFPYLYDESQDIAKAYQAACTPDLFLFDKELTLKYRGQFDDARPGNHTPVTGHDLKVAMDCVLSNQEVPIPQKPSLGCNIKWK